MSQESALSSAARWSYRTREKLAIPRHGSVRWKMLLFVLGLATTAAAIILRPILRDRLVSRTEQTLRSAQEALDAGDTSRALELAQLALKKARRSQCPVGPSLLVLGIAREQQAEQGSASDRLICLAAAAQHLAEAAQAGVAPQEEPKLNFHLAKSLHARGQYAESTRLLKQSLSNYPAGRVESLQLLALAYLDPAQLDLEQAYRCNSELIQCPDLSPDQLVHAWKTRREILERLGRPDLLADIELAQSPSDLKWVRPLVRACDLFQENQFDAAAALLTSVARTKGLPQQVDRRAWYLIGLAAKEEGDTETALATFRQVEWRYPSTPEAQVAATHTGAVLLGQGKVEQALAALNRATQSAASEGGSVSAPLAGPTLTRVLASAVDRLRDQGQFEAAAELVESYRLIVSGSVADRVAADLHEAWAAAKQEEAKDLPAQEANQARYRAAELYRLAGTLYVRVADAANSPDEAATVLWQAAHDLVAGEGYLAAVGALERLFATGASGELRAKALAMCCAALEGCGKHELIYDVAETCTREFPNHPATATARYHLARCQISFGDWRNAELNLRTIISSPTPDVDPTIVQQACLILAHLLRDQGRENEAIPRLNEIIAGPAGTDLSIEARLLLAECLRQRARRPAGRLAESQSEQAKAHYRLRKEQDLDQALDLLSTLQRELAALERSDQLTALRSEWLYQCRWWIAECLYEADRVEEAIALYQELAKTYTAPADWLEAQVQIANCHWRMNRVETARSVLREARARFEKLPPEAIDQVRLTMSPERWKEWTDWMRQL